MTPIFPTKISGTSQRVGAKFATNNIGMQMEAIGLGAAVIPSIIGILARRYFLEIIPVCLMVVFLVLVGTYRLSLILKVQRIN